MLARALQTISAWRAEAVRSRQLGYEPQAKHSEVLAEEMEAVWQDFFSLKLSIEEAAEKIGYTTKRLEQLVEDGSIRTLHENGVTFVFAIDLPVKAGRLAILLGKRLEDVRADEPVDLERERQRRRKELRNKGKPQLSAR